MRILMIASNRRRHKREKKFHLRTRRSAMGGIVRYRGLRYVFCSGTAGKAKLRALFTLALWGLCRNSRKRLDVILSKGEASRIFNWLRSRDSSAIASK
jgi:hypothetical protein